MRKIFLAVAAVIVLSCFAHASSYQSTFSVSSATVYSGAAFIDAIEICNIDNSTATITISDGAHNVAGSTTTKVSICAVPCNTGTTVNAVVPNQIINFNNSLGQPLTMNKDIHIICDRTYAGISYILIYRKR